MGSPGFVKDDFMKFLFEKATRVGDRDLLKQRSKFLKAHTSSGIFFLSHSNLSLSQLTCTLSFTLILIMTHFLNVSMPYTS